MPSPNNRLLGQNLMQLCSSHNTTKNSHSTNNYCKNRSNINKNRIFINNCTYPQQRKNPYQSRSKSAYPIQKSNQLRHLNHSNLSCKQTSNKHTYKHKNENAPGRINLLIIKRNNYTQQNTCSTNQITCHSSFHLAHKRNPNHNRNRQNSTKYIIQCFSHDSDLFFFLSNILSIR